MPKFGFSTLDEQELTQILQKYPEVEQAVIFGSRALGNYREGSDVDLTLKGQLLTSQIANQIWNDLHSSNLPYLFDLSIYHQLTAPNFIEHIDREGQIFYQRNPEQAV